MSAAGGGGGVSLLTAVPEPEGHELRRARATKGTCSDWLPADALYSASQMMAQDPPVIAFVVAWYVRGPSGWPVLKYQMHQEHERQGAALLADMSAWLSAP